MQKKLKKKITKKKSRQLSARVSAEDEDEDRDDGSDSDPSVDNFDLFELEENLRAALDPEEVSEKNPFIRLVDEEKLKIPQKK